MKINKCWPILSVVLLMSFSSFAGEKASPLGAYSPEWDQPQYRACNTAANVPYLSETEKEIIYILNMARMNPKLFCSTVVSKAAEISSFIDTSSAVYYKTLVTEMNSMTPMGTLNPDSLCYLSANCHASTSGKKGYVGHVRQSPECRQSQHFHGECCQYGVDDALGIVLNLLVDQDVPDYGHRRICLGTYSKISASSMPHKQYGTVTVMDFY